MSNDPILREHPKLEQVKDQFNRWRQDKDKNEPIPEELWQAATALCGDMPLSKIAKALRLGYNELKQKTRSGATTITEEPHAPLFIELPHAPVPKETRWVIEIQNLDGATMKITHGGDLDIVPLIKAFNGGHS